MYSYRDIRRESEIACYLGTTNSCITSAALSAGKPDDAESVVRELCTLRTNVIY